MHKYFFFLLIVLFLGGCILSRQQEKQYTSSKSRAVKHYENALTEFDNYNMKGAVQKLERAVSIDEEFVEAWLMLGQIHMEENNDSLALISYEKAVALNPRFFMPAHFHIGQLYFKKGEYESALDSFTFYQENGGRDESILERNRRYIANCEFALNSLENPVPFDPKNLGSNINSPWDEFINSTTVDERFIIFTVKQPVDGQEGSREVEDFYSANKDPETGQWQPRQKMSDFFNTGGNEGAMYISPDRSFLLFAACHRPDGLGSCDLYISYRKGNSWTKPENMGERVNSRKWDSHPTIAGDNKTVYFISTRNGGLGGADIWKTKLKDDGSWAYPQNLGKTINTRRDEYYPFIHPDNNTLYFSSAGHTGMGGLDFYMSRKNDKDQWNEPVNLEYPVNTYRDELGLQVNAEGEIAFFSTDRLGGEGRFDIFSFELPEDYKPTPVTYMKGIVFDRDTKEKLQARFELTDLKSREVIATARSDENSGEFLLSIPTNRNYALSVKRKGYLMYSENFELKGVYGEADPYRKDIPLQPIHTGETVVLNNIFFELDEYELLPESKVELDRLLTLLDENPEMKIQIRGHTDNQGGKDYNQKLSENRAREVYNYLVNNGINKNRLSYKGFGQSKPIADNSTEQGRAKNRRTEFQVIEK
ncbi:MAG: OmpA family protein [Bacteroidales bacterium]